MIERVIGQAIRFMPVVKTILNKKSSLRHIFYHRVNAEIEDYFFDPGITPAVFEEQLQTLSRTFKFISMQDALQMDEGEFDNHICISFDDGFRECYDVIRPILNKHGIKATFFLVEDCIDNEKMMWRHKLLAVQNSAADSIDQAKRAFAEHYNIQLDGSLMGASKSWRMDTKDDMADFIWNASSMEPLESYLEKKQPYMSDTQIKTLMEEGHEIGCHTKTHPFCARLTRDEIDEEIIGSSKRLGARFAFECNTFSYPFGSQLKREDADYVIENSPLVNLLGIHDALNNGAGNPYWHRVEMEMDLNSSYYNFYFVPRARRVVKGRS